MGNETTINKMRDATRQHHLQLKLVVGVIFAYFLISIATSEQAVWAERGDDHMAAHQPPVITQSSRSSVRQAYLLTINPEDDRTVYTTNVLKKIGFEVNHVVPDVLGNDLLTKVWSNKNTFLKAYDMHLNSGNPNFAYFFESDADVFPQYPAVSMSEIIAQEGEQTEIFSYLGVIIWPNSLVKGVRPERMCGRGAHAFGLSVKGLRMLVDFNREARCPFNDQPWLSVFTGRKLLWRCESEPYMDIVLENFCSRHGGPSRSGGWMPPGYRGGFRVLRRDQGELLFDVGPYTGVGALMQNREKFPTGIVEQPK